MKRDINAIRQYFPKKYIFCSALENSFSLVCEYPLTVIKRVYRRRFNFVKFTDRT